MADDSFPSPSAQAAARQQNGTANGAAPLGHGLRRAATVDETAHFRRRSSLNPAPSRSFTDAQRRDSTFSDFSSSHVADNTDGFWNLGQAKDSPTESSSYASIPLVLALLPAVGGLLFENGSAFVTDIILLGLAAIILRWSVTQPWNWYHAAQEIRIAKEVAHSTSVFESDSEGEESIARSELDHVPEEPEKGDGPDLVTNNPSKSTSRDIWELERDAAARDLRLHERLALLWCFIFPMLGAYLLHTIRGQLSRPTEGLVSDYNLCIFAIAAEIRPVAHLFRLIHGRTLRKQRLLAANPYEQQDVEDQRFEELRSKIEKLEARLNAREVNSVATGTNEHTNTKAMEHMIQRNNRDKVQPEIDANARAMRHYEKKLDSVVDHFSRQVEYLDQRDNDAFALLANVVRQQSPKRGLFTIVFESITAAVVFPFQIFVAMVLFPFRTALAFFDQTSRPSSGRPPKKGRRTPNSSRGPDRVPTRVSRR